LLFRVVLGLGPGRSGTKSLAELLASQTDCVHCEHEMIVPRIYPRDPSGRIIVTDSVSSNSTTITTTTTCVKKREVKGSWGADRRLEWDAPKLARGASQRTEEEEALWRVMRLLEQRHAFGEWVMRGGEGVISMPPKKLGSKGWREHNNNSSTMQQYDENATHNNRSSSRDAKLERNATIPVVAAVTSVGLAYVHEYIALDPSVRIVVVLRPCEEVVASFLNKSKGRNHWQTHRRGKESDSSTLHNGSRDDEYVQRDKTWDSAFPNMSEEECRPFMTRKDVLSDERKKPDKASALRAYCEIYRSVAMELSERYPKNVRIYDMDAALNAISVQEDLLRWCGFDEPVLETTLHLNKKK